jgi:hypothetical protein
MRRDRSFVPAQKPQRDSGSPENLTSTPCDRAHQVPSAQPGTPFLPAPHNASAQLIGTPQPVFSAPLALGLSDLWIRVSKQYAAA